MTRNILTFAMLLVLFGSVFAGTIVNVGETVPVGGTTTTTTTTTDPDPEPEPEPEPADSGGLGGVIMTNDDGDSVQVGAESGVLTPLENGEEGGESEEGTIGIGVPNGGSSESQTTEEAACGTAFALLAVAAFFARRS